jgi:hypothetical protein
MAALKENSKTVFNYVKAHDGEDFTAKDIAEATGLNVRQVNGIVTSAFQKKGLMAREEAEIQVENGSHEKVKFIRLTETGRVFDPEAPAEAE